MPELPLTDAEWAILRAIADASALPDGERPNPLHALWSPTLMRIRTKLLAHDPVPRMAPTPDALVQQAIDLVYLAHGTLGRAVLTARWARRKAA